MFALTFHGRRDVRLEELPTPEPGPGQVRVQVTDCLLSQGIVDFYVEGHLADLSSPHPRTGIGAGYVVGQQFGGVIDSVGQGVPEDRVGVLVGVAPACGCGACDSCRAGRVNHCDLLSYHGLMGAHGGMARYCVVDEACAVQVPRRSLGPLFEALLVVHAMLRKAAPWLSSARSIYVLGAGPMGLCAAAMLRDLYGREALLHDVLPGRQMRASQLGFRIASAEERAASHDLVLDCAGTNPETGGSALLDGLARVAKGGALVYVGTYIHETSISSIDLLMREVTISSSFAYAAEDLAELVPRLDEISLDLGPVAERMDLETAAKEGLLRGEVDRDGFTALLVQP